MVFRQLFDSVSSTYTYILADKKTRNAVIIDPVLEQKERDLSLLSELNLNLKAVFETHVHADHVTSAGELRKTTGAKVFAGKNTGLSCADHLLEDNEVYELDSLKFRIILTPGHTDGCTSYFIDGMVFTGDALMIRGCGRTDFQQGSAETLFHSIREKLFNLDESTLVYPGHDYKGRTCSSIAEEKECNPRLKLENSLDDFVQIMKGLNLPSPKQIDRAVPANLRCGLL